MTDIAHNALVTFCNFFPMSAEIESAVGRGDDTAALRAILKLPGFDFSDFADMQVNILDALRAASAADIRDIFGDGQTFKCGTLSLNDVLREFGAVVWGNLRTNEGAVVEMEGGGFVAVSGDCWDVVDYYGPEDTTARNGEGYYSVETDGKINRDGWFFPIAPAFDTNTIIDEEGMGYDDMGSCASLVVNNGRLSDDYHSERADLTSPDAFRAQVRKWKQAISA